MAHVDKERYDLRSEVQRKLLCEKRLERRERHDCGRLVPSCEEEQESRKEREQGDEQRKQRC